MWSSLFLDGSENQQIMQENFKGRIRIVSREAYYPVDRWDLEAIERNYLTLFLFW